MNLPQALKFYRERSVMTQVEAARRLGVSKSLIAKLEQGVIVPRVDQVAQLAHTYNCSVADLIGESSSNESDQLAVLLNTLDTGARDALVRAALHALTAILVRK